MAGICWEQSYSSHGGGEKKREAKEPRALQKQAPSDPTSSKYPHYPLFPPLPIAHLARDKPLTHEFTDDIKDPDSNTLSTLGYARFNMLL